MQGPSSPAPPLVHTSVLLVCAAGRVPTVAATPGRPGEARLQLEAAGAGYGATVVLVGPAEILAQVVTDLGDALQAATP
jgi:hypothetical protein